VHVRLLGALEVRLGDGPIQLGPRKQRAVFAMLALEPGRTVSADRLAEGLWGDSPPPSAAKMVQLYVSHLRRALGGEGARIVTHGRAYELELVDGEVDAVRAERLLEEARPREALALWRGEPLADLADEPFAAAEIRRLDELRLRAAETAIDADMAAGRHAQVIGELDGLVAANPLRERLHAQRMLALYRAGRQSEALEAFRQARLALVEQIGVEPAVELRRLHERILAQDPALDLPITEAAPPETRRQAAQAPRLARPRWVLVGAAVLLSAGIAAFGVIRVLEPDSLAGIGEDAVGLLDPDGGRITAQYRVGRGPGAMTTDGRSVWVANERDGTVSRIDRGRDQVVTIAVGGAPAALAVGAGSLWVADGEGRQVAQLDPVANKVLRRIEAANAPRSLALAENALWVVSGVDGSLSRIELDRSPAGRAVPLGARVTAIAAGAGAIWAASEESGTITRIDPRSGAVVASIPVGNAPSALAVGGGAVWVVSRSEGTLSRVDPGTNAVSASVRVGADLTGVAVVEGAVWVAGGEEGTVARVDSGDLRVVEKRETGSSPSAVAVAGGSVWIAAVPSEAAHRGGTLRVDLPATYPVPVNWLHENAYGPESAMVTSLAYDGLLAYRRVGGLASATLVGALATRPPAPSSGSRTYVFTLRRGLRYSDGTPVSAHDFRASMERYLSATRDQLPPFFAGIVGARRCMSGRGRCNLSRGIESDQRTRTITVHLTAPDPEFLHKLTLPFAYIVPAGTPGRRRADVAPPGTGPYRIASWHTARGGELVRNARFRPTAARPAGFADRIEIRQSAPGRLETHIAAVLRGSADVTWVGPPFQPVRSRERLAGLVTRAPGRLYSSAEPATEFVFLNVRRPPFDDIRVRRALNLATDRAELVELHGGSEAATATCQMVPAAFVGFSPYCPYTAGRARGGWIAPDLARARRLIAESGAAGTTVVVEIAKEWRRQGGDYFVSLLRDLGFRARLHAVGIGEYFANTFRPESRAQMGFLGWGADYMSASTFIEPVFGCATRADPHGSNASHLCSARLTAAIRRAQSSAPEDAAAAWAAADRRVVDLAPAVPYVNARTTVFVSKRVGNVTPHPQWTTLLDRMWVR
jgi:ABC-type transport system substrate-binding protein/DNA-binding SARP family transcriptional activator/DNA-binding beta-propeller fold protein YncE